MTVTGTKVGENTNSVKTATAECPAGKTAIGGSDVLTATPESDLGKLTVVESRASATNIWTVRAVETPEVNLWSLTASVICVTTTP